MSDVAAGQRSSGGARGTATDPVFLLSLPRSGSTLLQRLLGTHPEIATGAEPWLLLPLLGALRPGDVYAGYDHRLAAAAIADFCGRLPHGTDEYRCAVRSMANQLYGRAADGARYFLDKTPRYALMADDLARTFPSAHLIVLWRNPLAILASLSASWGSGRWQPHLHKVDLYDGLAGLTDLVANHPGRCTIVRYEDLVEAPDAECRRIWEVLGLRSDADASTLLSTVDVAGRVGDRHGSTRYEGVATEPLEKWRGALASPVRLAWCRRYLDWIGDDRLERMGYPRRDLDAQLAAVEPRWPRAIPDAARVAKGVLYDTIEPDLLTSKLGRIREWRWVHHHR